MRGIFEGIAEKMAVLKILVVFAFIALAIAGYFKSAEGALTGVIGIEEQEFEGLTRSQAEEVIKIWRVIGNQEIVTWDGEEWLAKTEDQKRKVIEKVCEAWGKAGYQKIESIKYFVEDVDEYYNHQGKKDPKESLKEKVGLVVSLVAFFGGMEIGNG